jgi:hypothetical protein
VLRIKPLKKELGGNGSWPAQWTLVSVLTIPCLNKADGQSDTGVGFLRMLQFPLPILMTPNAHTRIIRGWYNRPISDGRTKWTQSHPTPGN